MTEPKKPLPYLDRAEGEKIAQRLVAPMVKRVRHQLGLDIPREELSKKQRLVEKTTVATETRTAHSQTPAIKVEVTAKVTQNFPVGKDIDDSRTRSPFNSKRSNDKNTLKTQQEEENKRAGAVTPVDTEQRIDPVRVTESERKQIPIQEESEDRRMKAFVESVSDGELLILMNENGNKAYYRRSGDGLVGRNDSTVKTASAWKRHQNGWTLAESDVKIVPKEIPTKQDVKAPFSVAHSADGAYDENTEEDYASGKVFADQYLELNPPRAEAGMKRDNVAEEVKTIDEKTSEQYEELFLGDMWVAKNSDGSEKRILITAFLGYGMVDIRKGADVSKLREELQGDRIADNITAGTIDLEVLRNTLREDGYTREDRGSKSERDFSETQEVDRVHLPEDPEQQKIDDLRILVGEFRSAYVKEDIERTTTWKKLRSILGIERDKKKGEYQIAYEEALQNLRDAEMEALRNEVSPNQEQQRGKAEQLLRYYKLDEAVNLIGERTQYKAENQSFPEKIIDSLGALGRAYNRIPLKQKLLIAGALAGVTIATALSGGSGTALGAMTFVSVIRKVASGAGTAVGTEALLESFGERGRITKAEKEIQEQLETLPNLDALSAFLEKDIASLNGKLQNEKRAKTWRKMGAVGVGWLVGSGWLTQVAMDHFGGNEAVDWTKSHIVDALHGSEVHPVNIPIPAEPNPFIPIETQPIVKPDMISDMIGQDYVVQKGDSVWKIAGRVADTMKLEGAEKTHFIDALKDQYGDVRLKAGETINFSDHGINKEFVEGALANTKVLSPEQLASIASHDVKIAEYITGHPNVTLTDAKVDEILQSSLTNQSDTIGTTDGGGFSGTDTTIDQGMNLSSSAEQAIQENIALTDPKAYLMEHPEDFSRFNTTLGRIRMNIFTMNGGETGVPTEYDYTVSGQKLGATKISDVLRDMNGFKNENLRYGYDRTLNPLHYDQMKELVRFTEASEKAFGVQFSQVEASESIDHYTRRMATAVLRTGKEIKGFFKP